MKNISSERIIQLEKIYHCESAKEIQMLEAINNFPQLRCQDICWLIDTYCYHAAYWPHTRCRFDAFLEYIKNNRITHKRICSDICINHMRNRLAAAFNTNDCIHCKVESIVDVKHQNQGTIDEQGYIAILLGYAITERSKSKTKQKQKKQKSL